MPALRPSLKPLLQIADGFVQAGKHVHRAQAQVVIEVGVASLLWGAPSLRHRSRVYRCCALQKLPASVHHMSVKRRSVLYCRRGSLALGGFLWRCRLWFRTASTIVLSRFQRFCTSTSVKEAVLSICCAWPELHTVPDAAAFHHAPEQMCGS